MTSAIDRLSDRLVSDITWRIREISSYKRTIDAVDDIRSAAILRGGVPILYAHWEGFFVCTFNAYLNFVAEQGLRKSQLKPNFAALLEMKGRKANAIKNDLDIHRMLCQIATSTDAPFRKGRFPKIIARSNLNSSVLSEACEYTGLSIEPFSEYFDFIDAELIPDRNFIAHGESSLVPIEKFELYRVRVIEMIRILKNEVENAASLRSFQI